MIIAIIIIWLLILTKPQPEAKKDRLVPIKVSITQVEEPEIQPFEQVTGWLQPFKTAQIQFEVVGKVTFRKLILVKK